MSGVKKKLPRVPIPWNGVQVNFCKNPRCSNFGRPASDQPQKRGPGAKEDAARDSYTVSQNSGVPALRCMKCNEQPTTKSNKGVFEESKRMTSALDPEIVSCPNTDCSNHVVDQRLAPAAYSPHGTTPIGSARYRCKICHKTFTVAKTSLRWHKKSYKNNIAFNLLVHKMPLSDICEVLELSFSSLYGKIDFFWKQCRRFASAREGLLPHMEFDVLNLSVDRQDYVVNWANTKIKRNILLNGLGSADNRSGYVFGMHVNYDPDLDRDAIDADAVLLGDVDLPAPFRKYARVWLTQEYGIRADTQKSAPERQTSIEDKVAERYESTVTRRDIEIPDGELPPRQLPSRGMQIHNEYTLYGHFHFLRDLLKSTKKLNFYLDQESGIRAACFAAFWERILAKEVDAFYVTIDKEMDIHSKRREKAKEQKMLMEFLNQYPYLRELSHRDIRCFYLKEHLYDLVKIGQWKDPWLRYPFPTMSEPKKAVCYLTNLKEQGYDQDDDMMTGLYLDASLHGIDRFFMQLRRRVSIFERPLATSSQSGRKWYAYQAYNPELITKVLEIYRVYYNYVKKGGDSKTPAMRLGLAKGIVRIEDIVYFNHYD